jgi:hypothetical protein
VDSQQLVTGAVVEEERADGERGSSEMARDERGRRARWQHWDTTQSGLGEVCVPVTVMISYPWRSPVLPVTIVPPMSVSHAPGLTPATIVVNAPFLNCSTTVNVPFPLFLTVKWRSYESCAQSGPQVPESPEPLANGP